MSAAAATAPPLAIDPTLHLDFAHWVAEKFLRKLPVLQFQRDDVHAEAMIGLLKACRLFKPELGFKFTSYAFRAIMHHLQRWADIQNHVNRLTPGMEARGKRRARVISMHAQISPSGDGTLEDNLADRTRDQLELRRAALRIMKRLGPVGFEEASVAFAAAELEVSAWSFEQFRRELWPALYAPPVPAVEDPPPEPAPVLTIVNVDEEPEAPAEADAPAVPARQAGRRRRRRRERRPSVASPSGSASPLASASPTPSPGRSKSTGRPRSRRPSSCSSLSCS